MWELKPPKTAALLRKKKWTEPERRWFSKDQEGVGKRVPDWDPPEDINLYDTDAVQGMKTPYEAFRLLLTSEFVNDSVMEAKAYAISKVGVGGHHKLAS